MKVPLRAVRKVAMTRPGMMQDFIESGRVEGDSLALSEAEWDRLQGKWLAGLKLGTVLRKALKKPVRVLRAVTGIRLDGCAGCAGRELRLNAATARKG